MMMMYNTEIRFVGITPAPTSPLVKLSEISSFKPTMTKAMPTPRPRSASCPLWMRLSFPSATWAISTLYNKACAPNYRYPAKRTVDVVFDVAANYALSMKSIQSAMKLCGTFTNTPEMKIDRLLSAQPSRPRMDRDTQRSGRRA